jgi:hypothetical protein
MRRRSAVSEGYLLRFLCEEEYYGDTMSVYISGRTLCLLPPLDRSALSDPSHVNKRRGEFTAK